MYGVKRSQVFLDGQRRPLDYRLAQLHHLERRPVQAQLAARAGTPRDPTQWRPTQ